MSRAKLTPRQRVLRKWPDAWCFSTGVFEDDGVTCRLTYRWDVHRRSAVILGKPKGSGDTESAAWADAARRLR
jgi:hypothetical protein